jgi:Fur family ferric uptake transcriptional regulator
MHVTAQRIAVINAISAHPHATADQVVQGAQNELGSVSKQAVYDALHALSDRGIIRRIQPQGSVARYETRINDNHHHIICRECGEVADVDCAVGATPCLTAADDHGFTIDEAEVAYWGRCPQCQRTTEATSTSTNVSNQQDSRV